MLKIIFFKTRFILCLLGNRTTEWIIIIIIFFKERWKKRKGVEFVRLFSRAVGLSSFRLSNHARCVARARAAGDSLKAAFYQLIVTCWKTVTRSALDRRVPKKKNRDFPFFFFRKDPGKDRDVKMSTRRHCSRRFFWKPPWWMWTEHILYFVFFYFKYCICELWK